MDFSSAKAKLKKTTPTNQPQQPTSATNNYSKFEESEEDYKLAIKQTNLDYWYDQLKEHTIPTSFVEMTKDLAKVFVKLYLFKEKGGAPLDQSEQATINLLEATIQENINKMAGEGDTFAFVRCSTRSPKDSQVSLAKCKQILLDQLKAEGEEGQSSNSKLKALLKAAIGGMKVQTGKEAIELLSTSERIYEDLSAELEKPDFHQLIIVRKWEEIPLMHEYRGFVYKGNLNAISQYYHTIYFKELPPVWEDNIRKIRDYFESMKSVVPLESYIIDFGITETGKILVIELNPFSIATDSNWFSWKEDIQILMNGPFTAKLTKEPWPTTAGIDMAIKNLMDA
eukprot:TRINITY_DN14936_c0_g2_i1.p1 TRINITY_DN14936_c0_g2~~TRINITY_DN14936_c0_g2_i1.p1  ORF type:complete len:340 (-),score=85.34 TRINITY_DN14936_c0_g2_i1:14-1033(-)